MEPQEQVLEKVRLDGLTSLVVDDNHDTCEVLKQILLAAGASVRVVHNVRDGLAAIEHENPDIILTDLAMPGESGLVLVENIRSSMSQVAKLPIIVLSAYAFESDKEKALEAGASLFMQKPFKPNEVIKNVRQLTLKSAMLGGINQKQS